MADIYQELPEDERYQRLQANAYLTEIEPIKRDFTPEQMAEFKTDLAVTDIKIDNLDQEKKKLTADINRQLKTESAKRKDILTNIRQGYVEEKGEVFAFDDQELGVMNYYDAQGRFLYSRKLKPSERQTKIHSLNQKTGTNG